MDAKLSFSEPGSGGSYDEITWYKERTSGSNIELRFFILVQQRDNLGISMTTVQLVVLVIPLPREL